MRIVQVRTFRHLPTIMALLVILAIGVAGPAHSDELQPTHKDVVSDGVQTPGEALSDDTSSYAKSSGKSIEEVTNYVAGQGEFSQAADQVHAAFPGGYITAIWDGPTSQKTAIYVKPHLVATVAAKWTAYRIIGLDRLTEDERNILAVRLTEKLGTVAGVESAGASIDPLTNNTTISLSLLATTNVSDASRQALAAARVVPGANHNTVILDRYRPRPGSSVSGHSRLRI